MGDARSKVDDMMDVDTTSSAYTQARPDFGRLQVRSLNELEVGKTYQFVHSNNVVQEFELVVIFFDKIYVQLPDGRKVIKPLFAYNVIPIPPGLWHCANHILRIPEEPTEVEEGEEE